MAKRYVFDTNVFIQAKNREYRFDFCLPFWRWIESGHKHQLFYSSKKVLDELRANDPKRKCPARQWADQMPAPFFMEDARDAEAMKHYSTLMRWAYNSTQYLMAAKKEFARDANADAFIVAVARQHGLTIVTHETPKPAAKSTVPMHSAAKVLGVETIQLYDLLSLHANPNFVFKP